MEKTGRIKFYNRDKGYGIITKDNDENGLFFHFSNFVPDNEINELWKAQKLPGEAVTFEIGPSKKGERKPLRSS